MSDPTPRSSLYRKEAIAHQRERAWGELVVSTPRIARVFAWVGVTSVDVKSGDRVKAGQRLATISTERTAGGEAVFAAGARDAEARRTAIVGERKQAQALINAQQLQIKARIDALTVEDTQLGREIDAQADRVTQLKVQVERYRQLAREKFAPELQVQQKQDDLGYAARLSDCAYGNADIACHDGRKAFAFVA